MQGYETWGSNFSHIDPVESDLIDLLEVVSKASDVALVAMFGIDGFDTIKELRGRYL